MTKMAESVLKDIIPADIHAVWSILRDINSYHEWRSDIAKAEKIDNSGLIEYGKNGFRTYFSITCEESPYRWEFDIDNENMHGHWAGILHETKWD